MVNMDINFDHIQSANLKNIILCLETSTYIFKNHCRGGHQRMVEGLTTLGRKYITIIHQAE